MTLSEKREGLFDVINSLTKAECANFDCRIQFIRKIKLIILEQDKQFIKEILEEINNKIEKKIKVGKKSNNYTKDDVFAYGYVRGLEDMNKLFKRRIKQKAGEELTK